MGSRCSITSASTQLIARCSGLVTDRTKGVVWRLTDPIIGLSFSPSSSAKVRSVRRAGKRGQDVDGSGYDMTRVMTDERERPSGGDKYFSGGKMAREVWCVCGGLLLANPPSTHNCLNLWRASWSVYHFWWRIGWRGKGPTPGKGRTSFSGYYYCCCWLLFC